MTIHPKIKDFIDRIKKTGYNTIDKSNANAISMLKESGATATEATIVLHIGFGFSLADAENVTKASELWEAEPIQDVAYQTFLYMNYDPQDPNFSYDKDSVKFSLISPSKKSDDTRLP